MKLNIIALILFLTAFPGEFVEEGGIREQMTAAHLGYRTNQREEIAELKQQLAAANKRIAELEALLKEKSK